MAANGGHFYLTPDGFPPIIKWKYIGVVVPKMKRIVMFVLSLSLFLLSGCEAVPSSAMSRTETSEQASMPLEVPVFESETSQGEEGPLSSLLVGFEDFDLDQVDLAELPTEVRNNPFVWGPGIHLVESIPGTDISLYAPLSDHELKGVLVRHGDQLYKFDWSYSRYLFHAAWEDYDRDGNHELAVGVCTQEGTCLFHEELHLVKLGADGQAQDFCLPEHLYKEDLTSQLQCTADTETNRVSVEMGNAGVHFTPMQKVPDTMSAGLQIQPIHDMVYYTFADGKIIAEYGVPLYCSEWGLPDNSASIRAYVSFHDGEFQLRPQSLNVDISRW